MSLSKVPLHIRVFTGLQAHATVLGVQVLRRGRVLRKRGSLSIRKDQNLERLLEARPMLLYRDFLQVFIALLSYELVVMHWIIA